MGQLEDVGDEDGDGDVVSEFPERLLGVALGHSSVILLAFWVAA